MPAAQLERAVALDALRGIALFGVLMVNLVTAFRVSLFEQLMPPKSLPPRSAADAVVGSIITNGLEFKAITLFALLFGVGLAAQQERTLARGVAFAPYVARRLGMLLAIGLVHLFLIWNGDILTLYAVLGALAAPLIRLPTRALVVIALGLFVVQVLPLPLPEPFSSLEAMQLHIESARIAYGAGTFGEALAFRIHEVAPISALLLWIAPRTLALFLLGACVWRAGIFRGERRRLLVAMAVIGVLAGGGATWALSAGLNLRGWRDAVFVWGAILLAFGYGATIILGFERPRLARVLSSFAPLGRMALTSYLTQSIVLSVIFYGWGMGLFGRDGEAKAAAIGLLLFGAQVIASAYWLRHHHFGPVEWLWRSFTYGAWQTMRR